MPVRQRVHQQHLGREGREKRKAGGKGGNRGGGNAFPSHNTQHAQAKHATHARTLHHTPPATHARELHHTAHTQHTCITYAIKTHAATPPHLLRDTQRHTETRQRQTDRQTERERKINSTRRHKLTSSLVTCVPPILMHRRAKPVSCRYWYMAATRCGLPRGLR